MEPAAFRGDLFEMVMNAKNADQKGQPEYLLKAMDVRAMFHKREDSTYMLVVTCGDDIMCQKLATGGERMEFDDHSRTVLWARGASEVECLMLRR